MNIAFFITPKKDVIYLNSSCNLKETLDKMEKHKYTAVPIIDDKGKYVGTLTQGDILWKLKKDYNLSSNHWGDILIKDITRNTKCSAASINADIESLISLAKYQNFVPVVDDNKTFIGIIKRSDIINYCYNLLYHKGAAEE